MDFTGELCAALAGDKRFITAEGGLDVSHVVEAARAQDEQLISALLASPLRGVVFRTFGDVVNLDYSRLVRELSLDAAVELMTEE